MKSHKYRYSFEKYLKLKKWDPYRGYKRGLKYYQVLPSGYYENQSWGALHKAWVGYCIAISKGEYDREEYYARIIQKLAKNLGLEVEEFECLK